MTNFTALKEISDIFTILHDGGIVSWSGDEELLKLKVDCRYLAERIDKSFECFYVEIGQIQKIEFHAWMNSISQPQTTLTELSEIFRPELDILNANVVGSDVSIACFQHDTAFNYSGGELLLNCKTIKILTEDARELLIDALKKISQAYWTEFSLRSKTRKSRLFALY